MRFSPKHGDKSPKAKPSHLSLTRPTWFDESVSPAKAPSESKPPDPEEERFVDAKGLLEELFAPEGRPTVRWVRKMQAQNKFPYYKLGNLVRFRVSEVREALAAKCRVHRA